MEVALRLLSAFKTMAPWIAVWLVMWIADIVKRRKNRNVKENETKFEVKSIKLFFWIMVVGFLFFSWLLYMCILLEQLDWFTGSIFGSLTLLSLIGTLNTGLWRIRVDGNDIEFRSTFGVIKRYTFNDITLGVNKKSGALRIYSGKKRLFTFDDNLDTVYFKSRMREQGIRIVNIQEMRGMTVD